MNQKTITLINKVDKYDRCSIAYNSRKYLGKVENSTVAADRLAEIYEGKYGLIDIQAFPWIGSLSHGQKWELDAVKGTHHIRIADNNGKIIADYLVLKNGSIYAIGKKPNGKTFGKW
jgi:hypothetical protein